MPADPRSSDPGARLEAAGIVDRLRAMGPAVVALSGGVDSAVVARLAAEALGDDVTAITLVGVAVPAREVAAAARSAAAACIAHRTILVDPLADGEYRANPANRCFFCRREETAAIRAWGAAHGVRSYLDGIHRDDLGEARSGLQAMDAAGFAHPLVEAGWRKIDVRAFARSVGLWNWDRPSEACLASRVAHGHALDAALLARVAAAEDWLLARGFRRVRVRTDGASARVEVDPTEVARLVAEPLASATRAELTALGFDPVALDLVGYRPRPGA